MCPPGGVDNVGLNLKIGAKVKVLCAVCHEPVTPDGTGVHICEGLSTKEVEAVEEIEGNVNVNNEIFNEDE